MEQRPPNLRSTSQTSTQSSPTHSRPVSRAGSRSGSVSPVFAVEELEFPGITHLNEAPARPRRWTLNEMKIPSVLVGAAAETMAVPMVVSTGVKRVVPDSPFVATDGRKFQGDVQLWEPGASLMYGCSMSLTESFADDELFQFIRGDGKDYPFERRYGTYTYAVRICGHPDKMGQFAGVISWSQENLAQSNYDDDEATFKTSKTISNHTPIRNLRNRIRKAIMPLKKGQLINGWLTMIGKENYIDPPFESRFEEFLFREEVALQKEMGKKDEEFYHLRLVGVHPDFRDEKYQIDEMLITWFCYNADRAGVSCFHVLSDTTLLELLTTHGFFATSEVIRLRHGAKLNLPLLVRKPMTDQSVSCAELREVYPQPLWKEPPMPIPIPRAQMEAMEVALPNSPVDERNRFGNGPGVLDRALEELKNKRLDIFEDREADPANLQGTPPRPPSNATGSLRENKKSPNLSLQDRIPDIASLQTQPVPAEPVLPILNTGARRTSPPTLIGSITVPVAESAEILTYQDPRRFLSENREESLNGTMPRRSHSQRLSTTGRAAGAASPCFMWKSNVPESERLNLPQLYPSDRAPDPDFVRPPASVQSQFQFPQQQQGSIGRSRTHLYQNTHRSSRSSASGGGLRRSAHGLGSLKTDSQGRPDHAHYRAQNIAEVLNPAEPRSRVRYRDGSGRGSFGVPLRLQESDYATVGSVGSGRRPDTPMPMQEDGSGDGQGKRLQMPERALLSPIPTMSPEPMMPGEESEKLEERNISEGGNGEQEQGVQRFGGDKETGKDFLTTVSTTTTDSRIPKLLPSISRTTLKLPPLDTTPNTLTATTNKSPSTATTSPSKTTRTPSSITASLLNFNNSSPTKPTTPVKVAGRTEDEETGEIVYDPPSSLAKRRGDKRVSIGGLWGEEGREL